MGKPKEKIDRGIIDLIHQNWKLNWKIILVYLGALVLSLNIMWQTMIANPEIPAEVFSTFFSLILWAYLSTALVLIVKFYTVKVETILTKQEEENLNIMNLAEAYLQWVGAKPDSLPLALESLKQNAIWSKANRENELINEVKNLREQLKTNGVKT